VVALNEERWRAERVRSSRYETCMSSEHSAAAPSSCRSRAYRIGGRESLS